MTSTRLIRTGCGVAAAALVLAASQLPLWTMTMRAPQYPKGLRLYAYGTGMDGDLPELNILNHYIGMPPITAPALETSLFPLGIAALVVLCLLSPFSTWIRRLAIVATALFPLAILADLQWRLYEFGHTLNPTAPIRLKAFTPLVIGPTTMGNFVSSAMVSWGVGCFVLATIVLVLGQRLTRSRDGVQARRHGSARLVAAAVALALLPSSSSAAESLQQRIDAAPVGSRLVIDGGIHAGPIVINRPITLVGVNRPVIDGQGRGSVLTITGDDVVVSGFVIRNSGRDVTEEAAGIKASGSRHRIESNEVHDVYFGIHVGGGNDVTVRNNRIAPGESHGARPGHGISAWNLTSSHLTGNTITEARDGIYLSFTEDVVVSGNRVSRCRYGLHSMYSQNASFVDNDAADNLLGAALMMSDKLVMRRNRIVRHRQGAAAYGVLLKDIGDLIAEGNEIVSNRVGIYAEGVPSNPAREAVFRGNVIAGNEVGIALQSTAALTLTANRIAENLTDVRPLGRTLSPGMRWSRDGRGNQWSQYRGFDADGDGIGDVPHRVEDAMDALVRRNSLVQAFLYTPAHLAVEAAARMFPLYRQRPLLVDERPLLPRGVVR